MELKHKTDEQINTGYGLQVQSDRNRLRWRIRFSEKVGFELNVKVAQKFFYK